MILVSPERLSMRFVQPGTKNQCRLLYRPFLSRRLFPIDEEKKMIYHQDSARSHTLKKTIAFLNQSKINYVKAKEWMPKSAPIDYSIWTYLKQQLNKQKIDELNSGKRSIKF